MHGYEILAFKQCLRGVGTHIKFLILANVVCDFLREHALHVNFGVRVVMH